MRQDHIKSDNPRKHRISKLWVKLIYNISWIILQFAVHFLQPHSRWSWTKGSNIIENVKVNVEVIFPGNGKYLAIFHLRSFLVALSMFSISAFESWTDVQPAFLRTSESSLANVKTMSMVWKNGLCMVKLTNLSSPWCKFKFVCIRMLLSRFSSLICRFTCRLNMILWIHC